MSGSMTSLGAYGRGREFGHPVTWSTKKRWLNALEPMAHDLLVVTLIDSTLSLTAPDLGPNLIFHLAAFYLVIA
jgi:hypothetical protein